MCSDGHPGARGRTCRIAVRSLAVLIVLVGAVQQPGPHRLLRRLARHPVHRLCDLYGHVLDPSAGTLFGLTFAPPSWHQPRHTAAVVLAIVCSVLLGFVRSPRTSGRLPACALTTSRARATPMIRTSIRRNPSLVLVSARTRISPATLTRVPLRRLYENAERHRAGAALAGVLAAAAYHHMAARANLSGPLPSLMRPCSRFLTEAVGYCIEFQDAGMPFFAPKAAEEPGKKVRAC